MRCFLLRTNSVELYTGNVYKWLNWAFYNKFELLLKIYFIFGVNCGSE